MRLYHVSPTYNDASIRRRGLLLCMSRTYRRGIYAVRRRLLDEAIDHVRKMHQCDDVTIWILDVPVGWTTATEQGPLTIDHDVPPSRILGTLAVMSDGQVNI